MVTDTEKFNKALGYLHIIEEQYGSITRCPDDDPDYQAIRKIYPNRIFHWTKKHRAYQRKLFKQKSRNAEILYLAKKGYPTHYIAKYMKVNIGHVDYVLSRTSIKAIRRIRHKVITPNGQIWYVSSIMALASKYFHITVKNATHADAKLKNLGYSDIHGEYYWPEIPIGSYYFFGQMDRPIKKTSTSPFIVFKT